MADKRSLSNTEVLETKRRTQQLDQDQMQREAVHISDESVEGGETLKTLLKLSVCTVSGMVFGIAAEKGQGISR